MKRSLCILLTLLFLVSLFACSSEQPSGPEAVTGAPAETAETETAAEETEDPDSGWVYDDLGEIKFDGRTFNLWLAYEELAGYIQEEITGEVFDDAVYARNLAVEERLGVKLTYTISGYEFGGNGYNKGIADMKDYILAGDTTFDAFQQIQAHGIPGMVIDGYFVDWNTVPNVDLTKPYWHRKAIEQINYGTKIFMLTGFYENSILSSQSVVYFNKNILTDRGIEYPYQAVLDGTWTYDAFTALTKATTADLNGDGVMTLHDDLYGYVGRIYNSPYALFVGMGGDMIKKDESNNPVDVILSERNVDIMDRILAIQTPSEGSWIIDDTAEMIRCFHDGEASTIHGELRYGVESFRDMENDFGFVPPPKFDEAQEEYYSWIRHSAPLTYIPITNPDLAFTGAILEILAMESYNRVTPAYFDVVLTTKVTRDTETETMIPIILGCASFYDHCLENPNIVTCVQNMRSLTTEYTRYEKAIEQQIEELARAYS